MILSPRPPSPAPDTKPRNSDPDRESDSSVCPSPGEIQGAPQDGHRNSKEPCGRKVDVEISVSELADREAKLFVRESELKLKLSGLEKGLSRLKEKEKEKPIRLDPSMIEYKARDALKRLECDHICPL